MGCMGSLPGVLRSAAHLPALRGRCSEALLKSQNIARATLLLEFCASFDWNFEYFVT